MKPANTIHADMVESEPTIKTTKQRIFETSVNLFSQNGFNGVSIRDIAGEVGIKESSLYNHYKSKDEIFTSMIEYFRCEFGKVIFNQASIEEELEGIDPESFFKNHILRLGSHITPIMQNIWKSIYMEQFRDKRARDFVIQEIMGRPAAYYEKVFTLMMEKGLIKPIDVKLLSDEYNYALMAMSIERMLLQTDGEDTMPTVNRMFSHITFMCDIIKK